MIYKIIMCIATIGVMLGGIDRILGNRFRLGERFEEGLRVFGPLASSMIGILCLEPVFVAYCGETLADQLIKIGVDPAILGAVLSIDMGGYQVAVDLASDRIVGKWVGVILSSIIGCTLTSYIPVGMGMIEDKDYEYFFRGIILGLIISPVSIVVGGLYSGLTMKMILKTSSAIFAIEGMLLIGFWKKPNCIVKVLYWFARIIITISTIGIVFAAVDYMMEIDILPGMAGFQESALIVVSICIVLMGTLVIAEILRKIVEKPLKHIGMKVNMNSAGIVGLILSLITCVPVFAIYKDMDKNSKIINAAFLVCGSGILGTIMAFVLTNEPDMLGALIMAKLTGGGLTIIVGVMLGKRLKLGE